jgi:nitrite reductase/ring-hydroxylating ferredoxin subunit
MHLVVGTVDEIPPGSRKIVRLEGRASIGVFNVGGRFYALKNVCPHQGAPLCIGPVRGTSTAHATPDGRLEVQWAREDKILICPWHHWEFEISTGKAICDDRNRVATYPVALHEPERRPNVETYTTAVEGCLVVVELPD